MIQTRDNNTRKITWLELTTYGQGVTAITYEIPVTEGVISLIALPENLKPEDIEIIISTLTAHKKQLLKAEKENAE